MIVVEGILMKLEEFGGAHRAVFDVGERKLTLELQEQHITALTALLQRKEWVTRPLHYRFEDSGEMIVSDNREYGTGWLIRAAPHGWVWGAV